jgi:hypothetical protein
MLKLVRTSICALALSAFAVAPTILVLTADSVYAKNGNGGGNGGGKGGGNGDKGGGNGKGGDSAGKGNGFGKDKGNRGNGNQNKGFAKGNGKGNAAGKSENAFQRDMRQLGRDLKGLFGGQKSNRTSGAAQANSRSSAPKAQRVTKSAPVQSVRPPALPTRLARIDDPLHPSKLAKLNGAVKSSPNAKAAHIANGQYLNGTGPVSLAAALAVADYDFAQAQAAYSEDLAVAQATLSLAEAIAAAQDTVNAGAPSQEEVAAAQAVLDDQLATEAEKQAAQQVIDDSAAFSNAENFLAGTEAPTDAEIEAANDVVNSAPPSDETVVAAEDAILAEYKGSFSEDETLADEQQAQILGAVRASNPTEEQVETALGVDETTLDDDLDDGEEGEDTIGRGDDAIDTVVAEQG